MRLRCVLLRDGKAVSASVSAGQSRVRDPGRQNSVLIRSLRSHVRVVAVLVRTDSVAALLPWLSLHDRANQETRAWEREHTMCTLGRTAT